MPTVPSSGRFPQPTPSPQQSHVYVDTRDLAQKDEVVRSGPFLCRRIPSSGQLVVVNDKTQKQVVIDERVFLPAYCGVKERSVLVDVATGRRSEVLYIQPWQNETLCFVMHMGAP